MPLYLLPNLFDESQEAHLLLPEGLSNVIATLDGLIAERERTGRRYLIKMGHPNARELPIYLLNEHTKDCSELVDLVVDGKRLGQISDAGMPGIADPGAKLVSLLRKRGLNEIYAIPGPSSIFLALVLSGLGGQKFFFHGYLPKESSQRQKRLKELERESQHTGATQICIETPYRNNAFFSDCCEALRDTTQLCIASRLTFPDESVQVRTIREWKGTKGLKKEPAVFLFKG